MKFKKTMRIRRSLFIILCCGTLFSLLFMLGWGSGMLVQERIVTKEVTQKVEVVPENIVFLGDSLTDYYDVQTAFPTHHVVNSGIAGNTTTQILADMESRVYQYNPSMVVLLIGTNDLRDGVSVDTIVQNIEQIIEQIGRQRENAQIALESLYPVNASVSSSVGLRNNTDIQEVNSRLKSYAQKNDITYIDMYSHLLDDQGNLNISYTVDGLHLNTAGYEIVTQVLQKELNLQEE